MATLTDIEPTAQPPSFVKLTSTAGSHGILLARGHCVDPDLGGRWFCEIQCADGIGGTREIDLVPEGAHDALRAVVASVRGAAAAEGEPFPSPEGTASLRGEPVTAELWWEDDDLSLGGRQSRAMPMDDASLASLTIPKGLPSRFYLRVSARGGATITSAFPGETYRCEAVPSRDGPLPTLCLVPRWDVTQAYWAFLKTGRDEAAEAAASGLLDELRDMDASVVSDHVLVAAAHATLRFPWLRAREGNLSQILATRIDGLLDLDALDWARSFDRDPAEDDVFDERFVRLVRHLQAEPPAYAETVHVLLERLGTAVVERERMLAVRDDVARDVVHAVRAFASAARRGSERLVFEGEAPLRPTRRTGFAAAQKKTELPRPTATPFGI